MITTTKQLIAALMAYPGGTPVSCLLGEEGGSTPREGGSNPRILQITEVESEYAYRGLIVHLHLTPEDAS